MRRRHPRRASVVREGEGEHPVAEGSPRTERNARNARTAGTARPAPVGTTEPEYELTGALDTDPLGLFAAATADDLAYAQRARTFVEAEVLPVIDGYWDRAEFPVHLAKRLGELDLLREATAIDGFAPMSPLAAGLVNLEINRGDGSLGAFIGVQGGLVLRSIAAFGSPEQKERWLAPLARGDELAAFALTEPTHGSDSVALETTATPAPGSSGDFLLNGEKKWIGNGSVGSVTIVWARTQGGAVRGFLVDQTSPGYTATVIEGKASLRAIWQTHVVLNDVRVPATALLPGAKSFGDTARAIQSTRLSVSWAALGHATACYEAAVQYAAQRIQFGRPLAASQIVQERLARMLSELATIQLLCFQCAALDARGELTAVQASLAKYTSTRTARTIAANARDLLGGNGILLQHSVARHLADLESLHTYEGTETIQALLIGRSITGISAFS
ncbi:acyl-CoA dehydrogenase family protein [Subtercola boreus]|uniref:Acyl-CoA dehydrogenase n=1 Tax=Subtercola boreus TaxID=120213 RepID=A0A3E0WCE6_9MICO|nr:acyl-CoA dehydrogenase family protein [Subtercola boreus]RFA22376.1 acyl-CoA dehydrogenase [Subtercola boreus]RFA22438.1 acyl-CoA dehydrogenase [Subtercola boreus]RFA28453.1 acyl-CoA dehydrogenase [Subtercola boreus]